MMPLEACQPGARSSPAAEPRPCVKPTKNGDRQTILFLGNPYNPISTACLEAIVELGHCAVVGAYVPPSQGMWRLMRKTAKSQGWGLVFQKAVYLATARTRIMLRGAGVPLSGFDSLPELCRARGVKVMRSTDPNSAEFVHQLQSLPVDLIVVANFSRILKRALISVPRLACINVHPSLLPLYRGPDPFYWVLANREETSGVTIHHIDEGIDSGDIIVQRAFKIRPRETRGTLLKRSASLAAQLLREAIPLLIAGKAPRIKQDENAATYQTFPKAFAKTGNSAPRMHPR
jgi:folate-dependent phosphoribosylglycinamide formyltransferase PurN